MEKRPNTIPELLAPAGSMAALVSAVNAGADAIYLSGREYGARKYAENFSLSEIADAIDLSHMHGVAVHVTVNTLVNDDELAGAARYVADLYSIGADAVIVQDVGLARMIRDIVPDLPLHASTQATIYSREGVMWANRAGFERVILARETTLPELDRILALDPRQRPEIEIFAHGALCYCFSGQCLLSSAIGGRSGNRGMCAQPCRKPYTLLGSGIDRYGRPAGAEDIPLSVRYLLSTRDLMLYPFLREITRRDIAALKIEGRMRSPEYVGTVVSAYRNALDRIIEGAWSPSTEDMDQMSIIFSRGFTGGYLAGETGTRFMGRERPDNRGLFLGEVVSCDPALGSFTVLPKHGYVPMKGDGIAVEEPRSGTVSGYILTQDGMLRGNRLVISMAGLPRMIRCRKGLLVYVTSSPGIGKRAQVRTISRRFRIALDLSLDLSPGGPPVLEGTIHTGSGDIVVVHQADFVPERARTAPLSQSQVEEQLRKTGDPVFEIQGCSVNYTGDLFIPLGELNRFRREFYVKVRDAFLDRFRPDDADIAGIARRLESVSCAPGAGAGERRVLGDLPVISVYVDSVASARAACESGCRILYFEPAARDPGAIADGISRVIPICRASDVLQVWKWPPLPPPEFIDHALPIIAPASEEGFHGIMAENPGLAEAIRKENQEIRLYGGQGLNVFNHVTADSLSPPFSCLTLSPELSGSQIRSLVSALGDRGPRVEVLVEGNLLAMVSRDDLLGTVLPGSGYSLEAFPAYGLRDRTGKVFPVDRDSLGRTRVWNSAETCLVDHLPFLVDAGVYSLAIDARGRGEDYAREMTAVYVEALALVTSDGYRDHRTLDEYKTRVKQMARGGITAGYFARGLLD